MEQNAVDTFGEMPGLSEEHLRELGRMAAAFSSLEYGVASTIVHLMDAEHEVGHIMVARVPFSRLLDLLAALARLRFKEETDHLERCIEVVEEAQQAATRRNAMVHSAWFFNVGPTGFTGRAARVRHTVRRKDGLKYDMEVIEPSDLAEVADLVEAAAEHVYEFWSDLTIGPARLTIDEHGAPSN
jgi:hypothetical protein